MSDADVQAPAPAIHDTPSHVDDASGEQEHRISEPIDVASDTPLTVRLRDLAHQRAGCAALFEGERQMELELASLSKAIMVKGWLELLRKGGGMSQPTTRMERETLQEALEQQRDQRWANMLLTPGPRYAARNPEMYRKMHQRFVSWKQGTPIPSLNSEDVEDVEAPKVPNEGDVEDGRVEDNVDVVPAPVH
ncbi:hypothetical protein PENSPDRAFT_693190 [Peniophora sp. CONT]|nr:hypothetical protein PENSPDRAFT_693190 [Peniophora sp. CONT]